MRQRSPTGTGPGELVQDTAWGGSEQVPAWIVEGYETLVHEVDAALGGHPDPVAVPVGVGSLAQAVVAHYRRPEAGHPSVRCVETGATTMAGLNCGTPSSAPGRFRSQAATPR